MTIDEQIPIWDAVNRYAASCGGNDRVTNDRMNAVVAVNQAIDDLLLKRDDLIEELEATLTKMYAWQTTVRKMLPDGLGDEVFALIEHRLRS